MFDYPLFEMPVLGQRMLFALDAPQIYHTSRNRPPAAEYLGRPPLIHLEGSMKMFCYQCQEAANAVGCDIRGVCGKEPETAQLQDLLLHIARGLSVFARALPEVPVATGRWLLDALFTTITNANFDDEAIAAKVRQGLELRDELRERVRARRPRPRGPPGARGHLQGERDGRAVGRGERRWRAANRERRRPLPARAVDLRAQGARRLRLPRARTLGQEDPTLVAFLYSALAPARSSRPTAGPDAGWC